MTASLLVMTDGRDEYLDQSVTSALEMLDGVTSMWMHDDTGDAAYRADLARRYPQFHQLGAGPRRGFGGAIQWAWQQMRNSNEPYVFHLEADFVFNEPVPIAALAELLDAKPHLAQVALKRQPWWTEPAGGYMAEFPGWYVDCEEYGPDGPRRWVETTRNFTTNPCLYRRQLCDTGWPSGRHSEGMYGFQLRTDGLPWGVDGCDVRFGFWGLVADEPRVHHIGHDRIGTGY